MFVCVWDMEVELSCISIATQCGRYFVDVLPRYRTLIPHYRCCFVRVDYA